MSQALINLFYLVSAVLFILGLKKLSHPRSAAHGNLIGSAGMLLAVVVTLTDQRIVSFQIILAGLTVGGCIGILLAVRVAMTSMPQMVAIFNGLGGAASAVAVGAVLEEALASEMGRPLLTQSTVASVASGLIGAITFTGSMIAFAKLQGLISEKPLLFPGRHVVNVTLLTVSVGLSSWFVADPSTSMSFWLMIAIASVLGIFLVMPIGGADMPVVIALLNSYSGLAAAGVGWVLNNSVLIIAGSLVGAAGFILTTLMCRAMNRSLPNVMFAGVGATASKSDKKQDIYEGKVKATSVEELAMMLDGAQRVVIVPGYGLAVAQAQYAMYDLTQLLESQDIEVKFAIHPVAGRMPGHMNVLLAEANIPYEQLQEMDVINPSFQQTDITLVVGANDVVNPLAREDDPSIPIAGMPILDVDQSHAVVIVKRSLSPGFAGIANPLFAADNTLMLFGDAKQVTIDLLAALKEG